MFDIQDDIMRLLGLESHNDKAVKEARESIKPLTVEHLEDHDPVIGIPSLKLVEPLQEAVKRYADAVEETEACQFATAHYSARKTISRGEYDKFKEYKELTATLNRNQLSESSTSIGFTAFMAGMQKQAQHFENESTKTELETRNAFVATIGPLVMGKPGESINILLGQWRNNKPLKDHLERILTSNDKTVIISKQPYVLLETPIRELIELANDYDKDYTSESFVEITALLKDLEDRIKDTGFISMLSKCVATEKEYGLVLDPTLRQLFTAILQDGFINEIDILKAEVIKHYNELSSNDTPDVAIDPAKRLCLFTDTLKDTFSLLMALNHLAGTVKRIEYIARANPQY